VVLTEAYSRLLDTDKPGKLLVTIAIPTTTTAAATPPAAVTAAAAAAWGTLFTRTRFVDGQGTTLKVFLVKHVDCLAGVVLRPHFNKCKTT
jgi:hypothetical protein